MEEQKSMRVERVDSREDTFGKRRKNKSTVNISRVQIGIFIVACYSNETNYELQLFRY